MLVMRISEVINTKERSVIGTQGQRKWDNQDSYNRWEGEKD